MLDSPVRPDRCRREKQSVLKHAVGEVGDALPGRPAVHQQRESLGVGAEEARDGAQPSHVPGPGQFGAQPSAWVDGCPVVAHFVLVAEHAEAERPADLQAVQCNKMVGVKGVLHDPAHGRTGHVGEPEAEKTLAEGR